MRRTGSGAEQFGVGQRGARSNSQAANFFPYETAPPNFLLSRSATPLGGTRGWARGARGARGGARGAWGARGAGRAEQFGGGGSGARGAIHKPRTFSLTARLLTFCSRSAFFIRRRRTASPCRRAKSAPLPHGGVAARIRAARAGAWRPMAPTVPQQRASRVGTRPRAGSAPRRAAPHRQPPRPRRPPQQAPLLRRRPAWRRHPRPWARRARPCRRR